LTITNGYLTLAQFKEIVGKTTVADDPVAERAIEAASRAIDAMCERRFYKDTSATARVYRLDSMAQVSVDDFWTTTSLAVATDTGDDGTFETTWASSDYELWPRNGIVSGIEGWPYRTIRAVEGRTFPYGARTTVQVTAQWGWAAVPTAVVQACSLVANDYWKAKDAPFGIAGVEGDGIVARIRSNPQIRGLLGPYIKSGTVRV
jgi:hypothetical protein